MKPEQFNELLSYIMVIALNSTTLVFQQSLQRRLNPDEIDFCQDDLLKLARGLQSQLAARTNQFDCPTFGRADE